MRGLISGALGGPAIVALVNAAQLLHEKDIQLYFHGALGRDDTAERIIAILRRTPVNIDNCCRVDGVTPFSAAMLSSTRRSSSKYV